MIGERLDTLVALFRERAAEHGDRLAYTFLANGETPVARLTYAELDERARAIAARLRQTLKPGARALLLYPPGLGFIAAFVGCLYAGVVAVPAHPPHAARLKRSLPRLRAIVRDAGVEIVLATEEIAGLAPGLQSALPELAAVELVGTDRVPVDMAEEWVAPPVGRDSIALLQYTSGSTAAPKGVIVSHGNLLHNLDYINRVQENDADSRGVSWLPAQHDMGLIEGILEPAYAGYPAYLMAPLAFLQRPLRWLQAISRYRGTNSGGPNFAYEMCLQKIGAEERGSLDLSSWRIAYNGSEPVRHDTSRNFIRAFAECGFRPESYRPVYGLAEATLLVSIGRRASEPATRTVAADAFDQGVGEPATHAGGSARTLVACGALGTHACVAIVDPRVGTRKPPGQVGEIWISGPSVAQGYWNRPEETRRTFGARLADTGEGPFLRTGDLGFVWESELFITGRLKDLIIIRGRKLFPQDIELTVERMHSAIPTGGVAAFGLDDAGDERLIVVAEIEPSRLPAANSQPARSGLEMLIGDARQAIAEAHDVQVHAVALLTRGGIPRTSSGKLQRHACRAAFIAGQLPVLAQWARAPLVGDAARVQAETA